MLLTHTDHEEVERILLSHGFSRERSKEIGTMCIYASNDRKIVTYTEISSIPRQYIYIQSGSLFSKYSFSAPWIENLLKDSAVPKIYTVRGYTLFKSPVKIQVFYAESGDVRVITAVDGIDHASEIFNECSILCHPLSDTKDIYFPSFLLATYILQG